jgi:hypothetical protein
MVCVTHMLACWRCPCLRTTCVEPPDDQKPCTVVFLLGRCMSVLRRRLLATFSFSSSFFPLIPSKFALVIEKFRVTLLFIEISTLIFIILIFNFCSWPFSKILICFQFYLSISWFVIFFSNLVLTLLIFVLGLFIKLIFF